MFRCSLPCIFLLLPLFTLLNSCCIRIYISIVVHILLVVYIYSDTRSVRVYIYIIWEKDSNLLLRVWYYILLCQRRQRDISLEGLVCTLQLQTTLSVDIVTILLQLRWIVYANFNWGSSLRLYLRTDIFHFVITGVRNIICGRYLLLRYYGY